MLAYHRGKGLKQTEILLGKNRHFLVHGIRQMLEYKADLNKAKVAVDPRYTSQACPKCGHTEKANRDREKHYFCCKNCGYQSNDDRIGAMNLQQKGIEYIVAVTTGA